jgi:hypothetical protein
MHFRFKSKICLPTLVYENSKSLVKFALEIEPKMPSYTIRKLNENKIVYRKWKHEKT